MTDVAEDRVGAKAKAKAEAEEAELRVAVRLAEADAAFVDGSTLPIVSMMVAVIVASVILKENEVEAAAVLLVTSIALTATGFACLLLRPRRALRVVEARRCLDDFLNGVSKKDDKTTKRGQASKKKRIKRPNLTSLSWAVVVVMAVLLLCAVWANV